MNIELLISSPFRLLVYIIARGLKPWLRYKSMSTEKIRREGKKIKSERTHLDDSDIWYDLAKQHPELKTLDPIKWIKRFTIKRKHLETRIGSIIFLVWLWGYPLFLLCVGLRKLYDKF